MEAQRHASSAILASCMLILGAAITFSVLKGGAAPRLRPLRVEPQTPASSSSWDAINGQLANMTASTASFFMTHTELNMFLAAQGAPAPATKRVSADDVVFILKTISQCHTRVRALRQSWGAWAKHVFIISDKADEELGIMAFPDSEGFQFDDTRFQGHHFYHFIGYLWEHRPEIFTKPYFFLLDDDTWVNVPYLLHFLQPYSPRLKVMFTVLQVGRLKAGCDEWGINCSKSGVAWGGGGAGAALPRAAMRTIAEMVRNGSCPWLGHDDVSVARCAASRALVAQVHSEQFDMHTRGHDRRIPVTAMLSVHKVVPNCRSLKIGNQIKQMQQWSCSAAHRYKVQPAALPQCSDPEFRDPSTVYETRKLRQAKKA